MRSSRAGARGLCTGLALAAFAFPAAASAANTFVNPIGNDANDCTSPLPDGPGVGPCETVQAGVDAAGPGDRITVAPGTYEESVTLGAAKTLSASGAAAATIVDATTADPGAPVLTIAQGGGNVGGLTLRADGPGADPALLIEGPAAVNGNVFDALADGRPAIGAVPSAGAVTIRDNRISGDDDADEERGILVTGAAAQIADNSIDSAAVGIEVDGAAAAEISQNTITTTDNPGTLALGAAIRVSDTIAAIARNAISGQAQGSDAAAGVELREGAGPAATGAILANNLILDQDHGVLTADTLGGTSLDHDVISRSSMHGITATDSTLVEGPGDLSAAHVTVWGSGIRDIELVDTSLALDSTLTETGIRTSSSVLGATCELEFSRGPTADGGPCEDFSTAAPPGLRNPDAGDFHLAQGSPMIEAGNPQAPAPGAVDFDGERRLQDGDGDEVGRRDIGADEFPDIFPPQTRITKGPRKRTEERRARFRFTASQAGSRFQCALDRKRFTPCNSPEKTKRLVRGRHRFRVRAIDPLGNVDRTPAKRKFRVVRDRS